MVRPLRLALLAGVAALGAVTLAAPPAAAQFALPWGIWAGPPQWMGGEDDFERERIIPPRVVRRILLSQGYRLATPPRLNDDTVVAVGENAQGERVRFIIDGYSGQLLRRVALGGGNNLAARSSPDDLSTDSLAPVPAPQSGLGSEPAAPKAKPKHKGNSQTAARKPATDAAPKPHAPAPSQAVKTPAAPAPEAPKPEAAKPVAPGEPPKASVAAPAPVEKTPLAPDAATPPGHEAAPAAPAPQQAAAPAAPTPADKPPLTPDARAPAGSPQEAPSAKPTDIGPRVQPVAPQARAPEPAAEAKPLEANPAPAAPVAPSE
ncbi:MAG: hypothetical protein U1E30_15945 [Rhodoblastus sp.]